MKMLTENLILRTLSVDDLDEDLISRKTKLILGV